MVQQVYHLLFVAQFPTDSALAAHLDEMQTYILKYPSTVEIDKVQLINFDRYSRLASKMPEYRTPLELLENADEAYIGYLRHQIDNVTFNDNVANQRRLKLKKKEEEDHRDRKPELRSLGFSLQGRPSKK
jgi:hypothetical protein